MIRKKNGHAVTSVLPSGSDAVQVGKGNIKFPAPPPRTQTQPGTATITQG